MNKLRAKLKKQGGFTLIEMLIVVAIIAILIAIAIPLVNQALERSREATDAANERSFKAVLTISFLNGKYEVAGSTDEEPFVVQEKYVFDAANGTLVKTHGELGASTGYGKSTKVKGADAVDRKGKILIGTIDENGRVKMIWMTKGDPAPNADAEPGNPGLELDKWNGNLISYLMVANV